MHLKTLNIRDYRNYFEMVKNWLIGGHKETDTFFVIFNQNIEILNFCAYDNEKKAQKMISELRGNVVLSAVG